MFRSYPIDPTHPGPIVLSRKFFDDDVYEMIVRGMPISCVDVVFLRGDDRGEIVSDEFLLGKRITQPMKGVWVIGGRIQFDDPALEDAMARNVERETGLKIRTSRFLPVATHLYTWAVVAQGNFPGRSFTSTFQCTLTPSEVISASAALEKTEYDSGFGLQAFDHEGLRDLVEHGGHPMLLDLHHQIFQ